MCVKYYLAQQLPPWHFWGLGALAFCFTFSVGCNNDSDAVSLKLLKKLSSSRLENELAQRCDIKYQSFVQKVCRASNSWGNIRHVSGAFTSSCKCLTCNTNNESSEGISKASDAWWCSVMMLLLLVLFFFCALVLARQNGVFADQHVFAVISRYFLLWQPFFRSATSTNDLYCETDIHKAPKC